jgi:hypothetical protein
LILSEQVKDGDCRLQYSETWNAVQEVGYSAKLQRQNQQDERTATFEYSQLNNKY